MPSSSGRLTARAQAFPRAALSPAETARAGRSFGGGFTLLEILVTLALMALLTAILISGATHLLSDQPTTPSEIFRKALSESRQYAVENNVNVRLSFDAKEKAFKATTDSGVRSYPVSAAGDFAIDFISPQKGGSMILIGGVGVSTQTMPFVTFFPDGTCTPFHIQFHIDSNVSTQAIDPWTCAPVLEVEKTLAQ
jgi:prepilin-type N-terminal cleavage/methylation domain-containing protein